MLANVTVLLSAALLLPLPAPPPPGTPVSTTLFDALMAIERAAATNPSAAQRAAFSYDAAIQQYNAHDYERARASALTALSESAVPPAPAAHAPVITLAPPGRAYYIIAGQPSANQSNAERYVALAQRAMAGCGAVKAAVPAAVAAEYRGAVAALSAKRYRVAMAASRNIVDDCAAATPAR